MSDGASHNPSWLAKLGGQFIVFEGPDGSGKSTQHARLVAMCQDAGLTVCSVREPGGTAIGERIRELLLDTAIETMSSRCEMLLYMASRAQLVEERIRPALASGQVVLADRFVTSTIVYQGVAGGVPEADIVAAASAACGEVTPDLVLIFDVDEKTALQRMKREPDRIESRGMDYWRRVREGYLALAQQRPDAAVVIDARGSAEATTAEMIEQLQQRFEK